MTVARSAWAAAPQRALYSVFGLSLASGAISLGYQVMWFRIFAHRFGSTNLTFLLVLVTFIGGLGAGALLSARIAAMARRKVDNPIVLVGALEAVIAGSALLTLLVDFSGLLGSAAFPYAQDARGVWEPSLALRAETALATSLMFVPTFLMGTTFPILCGAFRVRAVFPSELYAWNTLGACSGVLISEFLLLRHLGHSRAFGVLVGMNLLVAVAFVLLGRRVFVDEQARDRAASPARAASTRRERRLREAEEEKVPAFASSTLIGLAALSGFVSGGLEVDMFRAVRFAGAITDAAMSFTSFWAIVAIFAASTTVRLLGRPRPTVLRFAVAGAILVYAVTWLQLHETRGVFNDLFVQSVLARAEADPGAAMSNSVYPLSGSLPVILGFTGMIVFPSFFLISLLLPAVCNLLQGAGRHLGPAYGLNTVAFCLGAVTFTWIAPSASLFYAVKLLFAVGVVAAGFAMTLRPGRPFPHRALAGAAGLCILAAFVIPRGFDPGFFPEYENPARYPVRAMKSNGSTTTYVVAHPEGDILYFNSHEMSGTGMGAQRYMRLMAHVPLLAQHNPRRALLICFGVGNTARAITSHRSIESLDIVDLNDKVFETADEFEATNRRAHRDPRVRLIHDDGRRFLDRTDERYDLITSEPPPPRAEGVYRLYSREYYASVLEHLTPEGMMTQWLPVNLLSRSAIDRMVASFVEVFPHVVLFVGSEDQLILLGSRAPLDGRIIEQRFDRSPGARADLGAVGIESPVEIFARILRSDAGLRQDVAGIPAVSDERNDLALLVTDPFDPPLIPFDPSGVLASFESQELRSWNAWREAFGDAARLAEVVPDFPSG